MQDKDKDKVKVEGQDVTLDAQALGLPAGQVIPKSPYLEDGAVVVGEDGKIKIDIAKAHFPPEMLLMADGMMSAPLLDRRFLAAKALNAAADKLDAFTSEAADLTQRMREAATDVERPVEDEDGFYVRTAMQRVKDCEAVMTTFYDEVSAYAGTEDILAQIALDIQAVAHPDRPFRAPDSTPEIG